jgi:hypothetical protein
MLLEGLEKRLGCLGCRRGEEWEDARCEDTVTGLVVLTREGELFATAPQRGGGWSVSVLRGEAACPGPGEEGEE